MRRLIVQETPMGVVTVTEELPDSLRPGEFMLNLEAALFMVGVPYEQVKQKVLAPATWADLI